jgi:hypothetical protein
MLNTTQIQFLHKSITRYISTTTSIDYHATYLVLDVTSSVKYVFPQQDMQSLHFQIQPPRCLLQEKLFGLDTEMQCALSSPTSTVCFRFSPNLPHILGACTILVTTFLHPIKSVTYVPPITKFILSIICVMACIWNLSSPSGGGVLFWFDMIVPAKID